MSREIGWCEDSRLEEPAEDEEGEMTAEEAKERLDDEEYEASR
jgi:hypothetical protein